MGVGWSFFKIILMHRIILSLIAFSFALPAAAQVGRVNELRAQAGLPALGEAQAEAALAAVPEPELEDPVRELKGSDDPKKIGDKIVSLLLRHPRALHLVEYPLFKLMGYAHKRGKLIPAMEHALRSPAMQRFLPPLPPAKREDYIRKFPRMIAAQLEGGGYVGGVQGAEDWDKMSARHISMLKASKFKPQAKGPSLLDHPGFLAEMEELMGARFAAGHDIEPLVDGPASFAARERLIRGAKKSVHLMTWGYYDDLTGKATRDLLIAKKREGLDVRVMVDGNISNFLGKESFAAFAEAGVPVARFWDAARKYDGLHSKLLVVDGEAAVAGGMNIGDKYSHLNPDAHHWRDTDVLFRGPAAADAARVFAATWNEVAASQGLPEAGAEGSAAAAGPASAALVYQRAGTEPAIYLSLLKAFYGATSSINIENAYFVTIPSLREALADAVKRGVKVTVLTNSAETNNEPILTSFILESLAEMKALGAEVYVQEGETLHSKFVTVDGLFASVGSYNFHPKSIRHEREVTLHAADRAFAARMEAVFAEDLARARRIEDAAELGLKDSPLNQLARRYMFDQL